MDLRPCYRGGVGDRHHRGEGTEPGSPRARRQARQLVRRAPLLLSYEITRLSDGVRIAVPGFQPFAVYDTILANLVPGLERREPAASAGEVLEWSAVPVCTQEVAVMRGIGFDGAREELGRIATQRFVGADGFWSLA